MTFKKIFVKEFSDSTHSFQGIAETLSWPCESTILSIEHFESATKVQLNSWWKIVVSDQSQFDDKDKFYLKCIENFYNASF